MGTSDNTFHYIDYVVNGGFDFKSNVGIDTIVLIEEYIEKNNEYVYESYKLPIIEKLPYIEKLISSVDERCGKLYRDIDLLREAIKENNKSNYDKCDFVVINDFFRLQYCVDRYRQEMEK